MSNIKKTIPTLVGGAMLLSNVQALAVEGLINQDGQNQEIESESSEAVDSNNKVDNVIEVVEELEKEKEESVIDGSSSGSLEEDDKEVTIKEEVNTSNDVNTNMSPTIQNETTSQVAHEEIINLLNNARTTSQQKVMVVKTDSIVVREGSATNASQVGTLKKNDYVDVYEQNSSEGWSKINYEGKMAYVNTSDLIDVEKEYKESIEDGVIVRSGAGNSYGEFGKLIKGERVQLFQELSNGWSKISYNGKIAFVETVKLKESYILKATVVVEKVNVYETALETASILGESKKGETLFIYGEEGNFYKVKFGEKFGFIKKSDLKLIESIEKPQTGDAMIFSYMGTFGVSVLGLVSVNRKKK